MAGCGGGGKKATHQATWIERADAVCSEYARTLAKLKPPHTLKQTLRYSKKLLPLQERAYAKLRRIKPPADQLGDYQQWLQDGVFYQVQATKAILGAARAGDRQTAGALINRAQNQQLVSNSEGLALGFKVCAGPPQ